MREKIKERVAEICDIPKDIALDLPKLILLGNRELQINNYKGLAEYKNDLIRLMLNNKQIIIKGENLHITRLLEETVFIGGKIFLVEFASKNKKDF